MAWNSGTGTGNGVIRRVQTLLPERRRIVKIGGRGHEFEDAYGINDATGKFDPDDAREAEYAGTYRVEVIPQIARTADVFLHVLEAADGGATVPTPTALLKGSGLAGARVGDKIVAFSTSESLVNDGSLTIDQGGYYRVLFCDLIPGVDYTITGSTAPLTSTSAGLLYADVAATPGLSISIKAVGN
jgi:hypothetical protein